MQKQVIKPDLRLTERIPDVAMLRTHDKINWEPDFEHREPRHFEPDNCQKRTVIVFDWNDTLCPTSISALEDLRTTLRGPLPLVAQPCLQETARAVFKKLLIAALHCSTMVVIVTNASEGLGSVFVRGLYVCLVTGAQVMRDRVRQSSSGAARPHAPTGLETEDIQRNSFLPSLGRFVDKGVKHG